MDQLLLNDVKGSEGCRLEAYKDSLDNWTIGYGHFLSNSKDWTGHTIDQETCDSLLNVDLELAQSNARYLSEWPFLVTACRKNAIIELVFNMGIGKWTGFHKTRQALIDQEWQKARDELLDSAWCKEVHETRANRLAGYLLTGHYPQ